MLVRSHMHAGIGDAFYAQPRTVREDGASRGARARRYMRERAQMAMRSAICSRPYRAQRNTRSAVICSARTARVPIHAARHEKCHTASVTTSMLCARERTMSQRCPPAPRVYVRDAHRCHLPLPPACRLHEQMMLPDDVDAMPLVAQHRAAMFDSRYSPTLLAAMTMPTFPRRCAPPYDTQPPPSCVATSACCKRARH